MPIYEYKCLQGHKFELDFKMGRAFKLLKCPECRQMAKRIFSSFSFSFKGGV